MNEEFVNERIKAMSGEQKATDSGGFSGEGGPGRPLGMSPVMTVFTDHTTRGFGEALAMLWAGRAVTRRGWNGKGMFLRLQMPERHSKMTLPYIYIVNVDQQRVPWLASQSDVLAWDWAEFKTE